MIIQDEFKQGVCYALISYFLWGIIPVFFKAMIHYPIMEIMSHRIFWAFLFIFILILLSKERRIFFSYFTQKKTLLALCLSAYILLSNWIVYIWAVQNDKLIDASLGYFMNPIVSILFGYLFLKEKINNRKKVAVVFVILGVSFQIFSIGKIPFVALFLATSFALYSLIRKKVPTYPFSGLGIETFFLVIPTLIYILYAQPDSFDFIHHGLNDNIWLISIGIVTVIPLIFFSMAVIRIPMYFLGVLQYLAPSIMLMIAIFYGETLSLSRIFTFIFIWFGICIVMYDSLLLRKKLNY